MAYWDGTQMVFENGDYERWGKTDAEHGFTSQESAQPEEFQDVYAEGFAFGTYFKVYLNPTTL